MVGILLPQRPQIQPLAPRLNRANPLARGMKMLLTQVGGKVIDVVNPGIIWTGGGNAGVRQSASRVGPASVATFDGSGDYFSATGYENITGSSGTFFLWAPRIGSNSLYGMIFWGTSTGNPVYFQITASGDAISFGSGAPMSAVSIDNTTNTSVVFTGTLGGLQGFFVNGESKGSGGGGPQAFSAGSKTFRFGNWSGGPNWDSDADIAIAGFTPEVWAEAQTRAFHKNPWQLLKAPPRRLWAVGAAPSVPTLSAATYMPGSLTSMGFRPRVTAS